MSSILIVGASGLVGSALLALLQQDARVTRIFAPTRRPLPVLDKIQPLSQASGDIFAQLAVLTEPVDTVFCCLGTTRQQAGSKEAFRLVDYDAVIATGLAGRRLGAQHMLVVSAMSADPAAFFFYSRTKGEMERDVQLQAWPHLTLARPSMLLGKRAAPRLLEQWSAPLFRLLPGKWRAITASDVARALYQQAFSSAAPGVTILESARLRALAAQ